MRTIRLNAYGTHKKAYRTLFWGPCFLGVVRYAYHAAFKKKMRSGTVPYSGTLPYQGPHIEARTQTRTNTQHKRPNSVIPNNLSQFLLFISGTLWNIFSSSATSPNAKIKGTLWGAAAKAMRSPREALLA